MKPSVAEVILLNRFRKKSTTFRVDLELTFLPGKSQLSLVKADLGFLGHVNPETEQSLYTLSRCFLDYKSLSIAIKNPYEQAGSNYRPFNKIQNQEARLYSQYLQ